uniref:F-box domain-containing protein n=4 Tax=Oryza TaxID=4527 RepID=A0A0E0ENM1_9ORYZ
MEDLPDDLLLGVLRRLPPISLAASRVVCSAWRAAVDANRLLRADLLPLSVAGIAVNPLSLGSRFLCRPNAASTIADDLDDICNTSRGIFNRFDFRVSDHCNGLFLVDDDVQHVVNPVTRLWAPLPGYPPPHPCYPHKLFPPTICLVYDPGPAPQTQGPLPRCRRAKGNFRIDMCLLLFQARITEKRHMCPVRRTNPDHTLPFATNARPPPLPTFSSLVSSPRSDRRRRPPKLSIPPLRRGHQPPPRIQFQHLLLLLRRRPGDPRCAVVSPSLSRPSRLDVRCGGACFAPEDRWVGGGMGIGASDELLGTFVPIAVYWLYSGLYLALDGVERLDVYRLHPREEEAAKNVVSRGTVVRGVLVQQAFQVAVSLTLFAVIGDESGIEQKQPSALVILLQFAIAMFVMDTWQYFMHRYMHINKFLYKHIHSKHHTLVVPYSFGALYNHPLEGLILDTIGGALSFLVSGMTPRTSIFFFSFATIKTVDDHCGLWLPGNILHALFNNNSAYHDIHHQLYGNKYNFSQPFFVMWDKILGTYMPYSIEHRKGGGFESRPVKLNIAEQTKTDYMQHSGVGTIGEGQRSIQHFEALLKRRQEWISLSNGTYRVIQSEPSMSLRYSFDHLMVWFLSESHGQMKWVLKHRSRIASLLPRRTTYEEQSGESWILHGANYQGDFHADADDVSWMFNLEWQMDSYDDDDDHHENKRHAKYVTFLGFHPFDEEVVFPGETFRRGFAYNLNNSEIQDLGNLCPKFYDRTYHQALIQTSFVYTPCWLD